METLNQVPAWLPVVGVALTVLAYVLRFVQPLLNEKVEFFKRTKIDDYITSAVIAASENQAKDIDAAVSDGRLTKDEAGRLKRGIAKNIAEAAVAQLGADPTAAANKVETKVASLKGKRGN